MRVLRGFGGVLLWIVASLLGVVSLVLCVTIILLPAGLPLLAATRRLFGVSVRLMLPQEMAHPVKRGGGALKDKAQDLSKRLRRSKSDNKVVEAGRKVLDCLTK